MWQVKSSVAAAGLPAVAGLFDNSFDTYILSVGSTLAL